MVVVVMTRRRRRGALVVAATSSRVCRLSYSTLRILFLASERDILVIVVLEFHVILCFGVIVVIIVGARITATGIFPFCCLASWRAVTVALPFMS